MKARILSPDEWARVPVEAGPSFQYADPRDVAVVAVEDKDGQILGAMTVVKITHFENAWVSPEHRGKAGVVRALLRLAEAIPQVRGEEWVMWGAADGDERMHSMLKRHSGEPIRARFYAKGVALCRQP
jgi:ribosomal protein S18 acetylase RimI-like enzyme